MALPSDNLTDSASISTISPDNFASRYIASEKNTAWGIFSRLDISEMYLGAVCAFATIIFSVLLFVYVIKPLEARRYEMAAEIAQKQK